MRYKVTVDEICSHIFIVEAETIHMAHSKVEEIITDDAMGVKPQEYLVSERSIAYDMTIPVDDSNNCLYSPD